MSHVIKRYQITTIKSSPPAHLGSSCILTFLLAVEDKEQHNVIQTSMILLVHTLSLFHILIHRVVHWTYCDKHIVCAE